MLGLNKPIRLNSLFFYINSKYEEELIKETKETYAIDLISSITRQITRNKEIKLWSDFEKRFKNDTKDNRSSKEIEEDILSKFKNLRQG